MESVTFHTVQAGYFCPRLPYNPLTNIFLGFLFALLAPLIAVLVPLAYGLVTPFYEIPRTLLKKGPL
jgi:hypothetical protein